jgi:hypothetical protein
MGVVSSIDFFWSNVANPATLGGGGVEEHNQPGLSTRTTGRK